jgi:3-mercaptopyruvate sulfurtransferase SseA
MNARGVVYCASYSCPASVEAGKTLKRLGYTRVRDFKGGMKEWMDRKYAVEGYKAKAAQQVRLRRRVCGAPLIRPASSF